MKSHILLVDDDPAFCRFVRIGLREVYLLTISHERKIAEGETGELGDTSTLADPSVVGKLLESRPDN